MAVFDDFIGRHDSLVLALKTAERFACSGIETKRVSRI